MYTILFHLHQILHNSPFFQESHLQNEAQFSGKSGENRVIIGRRNTQASTVSSKMLSIYNSACTHWRYGCKGVLWVESMATRCQRLEIQAPSHNPGLATTPHSQPASLPHKSATSAASRAPSGAGAAAARAAVAGARCCSRDCPDTVV